MKVIIDIPEEVYEEIQTKFLNTKVNNITLTDRAIYNGTPLEEELHREKEQAYYLGYEDGRKALIDDVKAEIANATTLHIGMVGYVKAEKAIDILDNIGKAESEDKE